ncbi:AMP-binding protein, partial [Ottowia sp.]|uniref:AMP-binding protein n=1 Tax=Ottowia sp. TaxID=1898956 RepID=UPI002BA5C45C
MIAGRLTTWAAAQHGARTAVVFGEQRYSHAEIEARSNRFAQAALALGLQPGERLAVLLDNSVESLDSGFGAEKAGLTYVALNARHTLVEQLDILADAQASAVLVGPRHGELAAAFAQAAGHQLPELRHVLGLGVDAPGVTDWRLATAAAPDHPPAIEIGPDHLMRIAYTSGTTGRPKGVAY